MSLAAFTWAYGEAPINTPAHRLVLMALADAVADSDTGELRRVDLLVVARIACLDPDAVLDIITDLKRDGFLILDPFGLPLQLIPWWPRGGLPERSRYAKAHIPRALRAAVYARDGFRCQECGAVENLSCDHIFPEILGGETTMENLQTLCRSCNSRKGARV